MLIDGEPKAGAFVLAPPPLVALEVGATRLLKTPYAARTEVELVPKTSHARPMRGAHPLGLFSAK